MKNLKRCRTKFGMTEKLAAVIFGAMLMAFPFASCNTDASGNEPNDPTLLPAITLSCNTPTVEKEAEIVGTVVFSNFENTPTTIDIYVEGEEDAVKSNVPVNDGKFTFDTQNLQIGTHNVYVKRESVKSNLISITINKIAGSISYATANVNRKPSDAKFTNVLTYTGDGTVTYSSSNTDVAIVNATTGEVTIKGKGATTITATVRDSDTYTYATNTASYTLTTASLADVFLNGSVTTIKFTTCFGAKSATFENNNGTFSVTSGACSTGMHQGLKTVTLSGNNLTIIYGFEEQDFAKHTTTFTFNKGDNSYSIVDSGYFEISDITVLEVNGADIKNTLTKK